MVDGRGLRDARDTLRTPEVSAARILDPPLPTPASRLEPAFRDA